MSKNETIILTGNTYNVRDQIKRIGGQWDAARKGWIVRSGTMRERAEQSRVIYGLRREGVRAESI